MGTNEMLVFSDKYFFLEKLGARNETTDSLVLHPSGDLYQIGVFAAVLKVENVWDPEAKKKWAEGAEPPQFPTELSQSAYLISVGLWWQAKTNAPSVRLRMHANTTSSVVKELSQGTQLTVLEESPEKVKIGDKTAPWYMVRTWNGVQGWIYGGFIDIQR